MERLEAALPIFKLIYYYQSQLEKIQNDLFACAQKNLLNLVLQQIYYEISHDKNYLTTGDMYRFVKSKKIFFNVSNLIQFFSFYDLDNDSYLSLKEFGNLFSFDIVPLKHVARAELNTQVVCVFVNLLMKELELCEQLRTILSEFYSKNKTVNSNDLFQTITNGDNKDMIEFDDLEKCITGGKLNKEQIKLIYMKLSSNSLEPITKRQFEKYFRTLALSNDNNELMVENEYSMMMNSSQLSEILNNAVCQTKLQNSELSQQKKKFEYEMFNAFIKCLITADTTLSSIMASEQYFCSGTLFNLIKKCSPYITKEDLYNQLKTFYNITPSNDDIDLLFEKYSCQNGHTMSYELFNIMLKVSTNKGKEESKFKENITMQSFSPVTNKKISEMFKTLLRNEKTIEDFRKKLNKMSHFNLREIYNDISKGDGYVTSFDLSNYFSITNQDADVLMRRFDKDNDGKISYDDVSIFPL